MEPIESFKGRGTKRNFEDNEEEDDFGRRPAEPLSSAHGARRGKRSKKKRSAEDRAAAKAANKAKITPEQRAATERMREDEEDEEALAVWRSYNQGYYDKYTMRVGVGAVLPGSSKARSGRHDQHLEEDRSQEVTNTQGLEFGISDGARSVLRDEHGRHDDVHTTKSDEESVQIFEDDIEEILSRYQCLA